MLSLILIWYLLEDGFILWPILCLIGTWQFAQVEHAMAAQSLNGKLEIAGRYIKVHCCSN